VSKEFQIPDPNVEPGRRESCIMQKIPISKSQIPIIETEAASWNLEFKILELNLFILQF
jgi:hypothetical protein